MAKDRDFHATKGNNSYRDATIETRHFISCLVSPYEGAID